jgi:uncharacterized membrane protein
VFSPVIFWPCLAGVIILAIGFVTARKELSSAAGLEKLIVLGPTFFAAPLAVFGGEHLVSAKFLAQAVPPWMPGHLFWAYFVGCCLIAAALSLVLKRQMRLSSTLLAIMFCVFVATIHLPNAAANPKDRILWSVAARDLFFGAGACALAESLRPRGPNALLTVARVYIVIALIFFAVEHFLHPEFAPGVPLPKVTPAWVPFHLFLGYFAGAVLFIGAAAMLAPKLARSAAAWVGLLITLLTVFLYLPIMTLATQTPEFNEGQNYIFDTLLFAGAILLLAAAMPRSGASDGAGVLAARLR